MPTIRDGIYLEDHPPRRSQYRVGRRAPIKSVIVVHTAEPGTDLEGPDPKAEHVAEFIQDRTEAGSYHLIGDADSILQLVRFENEAYHDGTGSNRWAIGISLAMDAADWPKLSDNRRAEMVDTAATMAALSARWLQSKGLDVPEPVRLTKGQSDRPGASGFIDHGRRDPRRRSDPGAGFPWAAFFAAYRLKLGMVGDKDVTALQVLLNRLGASLVLDGIFGPKTLAAAGRHLNRSALLAKVEAVLRGE